MYIFSIDELLMNEYAKSEVISVINMYQVQKYRVQTNQKVASYRVILLISDTSTYWKKLNGVGM